MLLKEEEIEHTQNNQMTYFKVPNIFQNQGIFDTVH